MLIYRTLQPYFKFVSIVCRHSDFGKCEMKGGGGLANDIKRELEGRRRYYLWMMSVQSMISIVAKRLEYEGDNHNAAVGLIDCLWGQAY